MAELICIESVKEKRAQEERAKMVEGLEELRVRAEAGELAGVVFVAVPTERESLSVGLLKTTGCGNHELVGAAVMMSDYLRKRLGTDSV